jgi:hypothetical protein
MSFKYTKGPLIIGDLSGSDDSDRDTGINFEEDYIDFKTNGSIRLKMSGAAGELTFNEAFTFPTADGSSNQVLKTNGSGQLSWASQAGGTTSPGGSNAYIQFNDNSSFSGTDKLIWTAASSQLAVNGEERIVGAATTGYASERSFTSERVLAVSSSTSGWVDFLTIQQLNEGLETTSNKWGHIAYDIFIIGNLNGKGTTLRHVIGAVEFRNGSMGAYTFSNTTTGGGSGQMGYQVSVDNTSRTATFQIEPIFSTSNGFGGTIAIKIIAGRGDPGQTQDYTWLLASGFD